MMQKTTKLGSSASNVEVGKIAVCYEILWLHLVLTDACLSAWAHDDDVRWACENIRSHFLTIFSRFNPIQVPDDQCFESIKAGVDSLPKGTKMMLNSGWSLIVRFREHQLDDSRIICARRDLRVELLAS